MNTPESTPSLQEAAQRAYDYYVGLLYKGELKPEDEAQYNHLREKEKAGEIQPSSERRVITDGEALATLVRAQDSQESTARFDLWIDQLQLETDKTPGGLGRIECAIRRASVYYRAGFKDKAIGDLEDTQRAALCEPEKPADLDQKIASLLDRMRADQSIV